MSLSGQYREHFTYREGEREREGLITLKWFHNYYKLIYSVSIIHTILLSSSPVTMTTTDDFCSQTILQKSSTVQGSGPWLAMYDRLSSR